MAANFEHWKSQFHILTWNVSSKYPENLPVHILLGLEKKSEMDTHQPDFIVIGLQEINSQPQSMVKGLFKDDPWTQRFKELLSERGYVAIKSLQMQGLLLVVFMKRKHLLHVREVETEYTRTGLGGMWGNKGAVSIRFKLYGVSVCLVNSHLAAHDHMLDERIKDFEKIVDEHKFHVKKTRDIFQHDYVFWFGDLNFRLTKEDELSHSDIKEMVHRDRLDELVELDQLSMIRRQGRAFAQLEERLPAFPPTFKFEHGTNDYDTKRRPAWCDRILYKTPQAAFKNMELVTEQTSYRSHPQFTISDHKPVTSEFTINVYEDPTDKMVEFTPLHIWEIGEENNIEYTLPLGFDEMSSDWVGIYKENFDSLDDYITYEYTSRSKAPNGDYPHDKVIYHLEFPDTVDLEEDQRFVLLYFHSSKNVTSLVGISEPFKAEKRCPSPRFESVD
ncbi:inositol polyphosphate 5-phosphatase K [Sitodiplosis mosellana]|uniref:inositol polyphosphate 5-phosphatase K n=1 Tax=Sitodiplosis mosellana TaxID=263140 RepID=UPI002444EECD|nr:inositol polyphosphate 5-phosphatase K [Sitodiplosis mosellana]XP_055317822.1 inositol polyphosphate 5-phosphatase K [Sitodiplosis mosellana]XP_055317823.1 inositol polyphosphate 5-phosphatase K [Sitodiplosis mosellana]XP_055317824.1 inositol polyphosphate 5-phosphatase K [Sitodiplosis mosellana]XP_055317825.1 inositol polyphosphate 5-phosphatase K [Sitodiplosis mosellana]